MTTKEITHIMIKLYDIMSQVRELTDFIEGIDDSKERIEELKTKVLEGCAFAIEYPEKKEEDLWQS